MSAVVGREHAAQRKELPVPALARLDRALAAHFACRALQGGGGVRLLVWVDSDSITPGPLS